MAGEIKLSLSDKVNVSFDLVESSALKPHEFCRSEKNRFP